ncbi:MAG: hypothetical protein ACI9XO_003123 [Paraglaciecola sp.]|jgi:hypothetical protein
MSTPKLLATAYVAIFSLFILPQDATAICLPTTVSTFSNELETTVCVGDGEADVVKFKPSTWATAYRFIVTDQNDVIIAWFSGNNFDFENFDGGVSRVYGLSYSGVPNFPIGENIHEVDFGSFCWILSDNYVVVNRVIPDAGNVLTASGDTVAYTCPDGNPDVLSFGNMNTSIGNYAYLIADAAGIILGVSEDGDFDFEGLPEGSCFVYGVAYAGNLTATVGDDINTADLSDTCYDLSDTAVEVFKDVPEGGTVSLLDGGDFIEICVGDGQPSPVVYMHQNPSNSLYGYLITDENGNLLGTELDDIHDFAGASVGICHIYGVAYTGSFITADGNNIFSTDITDDCYSISTNFITVERNQVDGGSIATLAGEVTVFSCPNDGIVDVVSFQNMSIGSVNYGYIIADTTGNILDFATNNSYDFENAGEGVCRVYGLSYFESFDQTASNIFTDILSDDCFELSTNFIEIYRETPNAGDLTFINGDTIAYTCPGDGNADVVAFEIANNSQSKVAYAITNAGDEVLAITSSGTWDFEDASEGICRIYSLAYTGNLILSPADTLHFDPISDDCFAISVDYIEVVRETPNGGLIELANGETDIFTCPGNGSADIVEFVHTDASNSPYAYIILDENNIVLAIETGDSYDFENAPLGECLVLGVAYTGNITMQLGDDASIVVFSDDCFSFSDNLITVRRINPEGGILEFSNGAPTMTLCAGDDNNDIISIVNVDAEIGPYIFIITDENDVILGNTFAFNIDFDIFPSQACRVYGVSFTGDYQGMIGDTLQNIDLSNDCFDVSDNHLTIIKTYVNAGGLTTVNGEQSVIICPNDGNPNVIEFATNSDAQDSDYQYIVTNNQGVILALPTINSFDFEPAGVGICKVYGISYIGDLVAELGDNITDVMSTECFDVSESFIEIVRDQPSGDIIVSDLGDVVDFCVNDGEADVVNFITGSFSFAAYAYIITDENNIVMSVEFNDFHDFDFAPAGVCRVWGISYTGNIIAGEGDNLDTDALSDDCFDVSNNFITINRIVVDGATIFTPGNTTEIYTCPGDGNGDFVGLFNTSNIGADYKYIITNEMNMVVDVLSFNLYDFENIPEGTCRIYGMSHTGIVEIEVGDDLFSAVLTDGCYDISDNFLTVYKVNPDGGLVTTEDGETEVTIFIDGVADTLNFVNDGSITDKQRYVITDENEVILGITEDDFVDFENAGIGVCHVYNLIYTSGLIAEEGDIFQAEAPASGCWDVSANFVTVTRLEMGSNLGTNGGLGTVVSIALSLELSPNPASDYIKIEFNTDTENQGQIQIVDLSGKVLFKEKSNFEMGINTVDIPVYDWQNGFYLVTIQNGKEFLHEKFVKD